MIFDDGKLHIFIITITFSKMALVGFLKKVHFPLQILNFRFIGRCHSYYAVLCAHVGGAIRIMLHRIPYIEA